MRNLLTSLAISFALIATASPSFASDDREDKKRDRDKKEQRHVSKKENQHHNPKQALNILLDAMVICPPNSPTRFVDNGDGTICDHETGLMWEMKDSSDGTPDLNNPRDVDNTYTWTNTADGDNTNPDGTAYTDFLARLNGEISTFSPESPPEQLGGYSDWRLPTGAELAALFDCTFDDGTINSDCIDPIFEPTAVGFGYWSSTSSATDLVYAWTVTYVLHADFLQFLKSEAHRVRAVRGGP